MTAVILGLTGASILGETPVLGQITAMNSAMNYTSSFARDVAGYLAGQPAGDEEAHLDLLCPPIQVNDFFRYPKADDEFFLTEADDSDIRASGATFKRVQYRGTKVVDETVQKGLTMRVDHKDIPKIGTQYVSGWENNYATHLKHRLIRAELIRFYSLLDAAATNQNKTWNASANPDGDIREMIELGRVALGHGATHVVMGSTAAELRKDAYEDEARANHSMSKHAEYTAEQLATYLGVNHAITDKGINQVKKGAAKVARVGLSVYSYFAGNGVVMEDPSNFKRAWSATKKSGGKWAVSIKEDDVFTDITVWHESKLIAPITAGVRKQTIS